MCNLSDTSLRVCQGHNAAHMPHGLPSRPQGSPADLSGLERCWSGALRPSGVHSSRRDDAILRGPHASVPLLRASRLPNDLRAPDTVGVQTQTTSSSSQNLQCSGNGQRQDYQRHGYAPTTGRSVGQQHFMDHGFLAHGRSSSRLGVDSAANMQMPPIMGNLLGAVTELQFASGDPASPFFNEEVRITW